MRRRLAAVILGAFVAAAVAVAAAQSQARATDINIGWDGDQSGQSASSQAPIMHAIEAYFRMTNDAGGVDGHKLNLLERDDAYSATTELSVVKSLINDDHVPVIMGLGQAAGLSAVVPVLTQTQTVGFMTQATAKAATYPFQPWVFEGNCNLADQGDVALAFEMRHLKLKNLNGLKVGVASMNVASGTEWDQNISARIQALGGTPVHESLPVPLADAAAQVQDLISNKVAFVLLHHSMSGGIAFVKSADQYNLNVPIATSHGSAQPLLFSSTPYNANKNVVVVNCVSPPYLASDANGKLAQTIAQKYGYSAAEYGQSSWLLGWIGAQTIVQALKNAKGDYTGAGVKKGLEAIKNLDTGLSPNISYASNCHMGIRAARPFTYNYKTDQLVPIGRYQDWQSAITSAYAGPGTCGVARTKK